MIELLTAPETLTAPALAHRYMVQLASIEIELDAYGVPVPATTKMLDVCVVEPSLAAITTLLNAAGHLEGFEIVRHWIPEDCNCF